MRAKYGWFFILFRDKGANIGTSAKAGLDDFVGDHVEFLLLLFVNISTVAKVSEHIINSSSSDLVGDGFGGQGNGGQNPREITSRTRVSSLFGQNVALQRCQVVTGKFRVWVCIRHGCLQASKEGQVAGHRLGCNVPDSVSG